MVVKLDPELSILKKPDVFGRRLLMERYYPKNMAENLWDQMVEMGDLISDFPKNSERTYFTSKKWKNETGIIVSRKGF